MKYPDIDSQKSFYDERWMKVQKRRLPQHLENRLFAVRRLMKSYPFLREQILEIGSGLGRISNLASEFGKVEGLELSAKAVSLAQQLYPQCSFIQGDVFEHSLEANHYDLIVTSEVIEHIPVELRDRFIEICYNALKLGGYLILTTPNKIVSDHINKEQPIENHFTSEELASLLQTRFQIVHFSTIQNFIPKLCHKFRVFQVIRLLVYEVFRLRGFFEDPMRNKQNGLHFVVLAQRSESH